MWTSLRGTHGTRTNCGRPTFRRCARFYWASTTSGYNIGRGTGKKESVSLDFAHKVGTAAGAVTTCWCPEAACLAAPIQCMVMLDGGGIDCRMRPMLNGGGVTLV